MDTILEGDHPRTIWTNFYFIPSSCSEEDFQFFNQLEALEAILDIQQDHWT